MGRLGPLPSGFKSGLLTVVEDLGCRAVRCRCECGTERIYLRSNIRSRLSRSCGCVGSRKTAERNRVSAIHGESRSRLYNIYRAMIKRCYLKTCKDYRRYGARGVTVCAEWKGNPEAFIEWAKSHGYSDNLTLDRIAGGTSPYSPENCRWATVKQQNNNRSSNSIVEFRGKRYTLVEFAEAFGINYDLVQGRFRRGWTAEQMYDNRNPLKPGKFLLLPWERRKKRRLRK